MAIAFDASNFSSGGTSTSITLTSLTVGSLSNGIIIVNFRSSLDASSVTCNAASMTKAGTTVASGIRISSWYLLNPSSGSNSVVLNFASGDDAWASVSTYSGVDSIDEYQASATGSLGGGGGGVACTFGGSVSGEWAVIYGQGNGTPTMTGTPYSQRGTNASPPVDYGDSGTPISGSTTYTYTLSLFNGVCGGITIKPSTAVGPANVKTWDGITQSSGIKTYQGVALASVKSWDGIV